MCTAIAYRSRDRYFGRNLDLERGYGEQVVITPRRFSFRHGSFALQPHYAMIGMATVSEGFPLYYDATNEKGLSMAGLNFPGNAHYYLHDNTKTNITPFELIPWILGNCQSAQEAELLLNDINLWNSDFSDSLPLSPLHWLLCDRNKAITIEATIDGLKLYENPVGVLTNNPPFPYHIHNLSHEPPTNNQPIVLKPYSLGMGSFGLPGDMSSGSRFVKAAFTKMHSVCDGNEKSSVSQFFQILSSVEQPKGLTKLESGEYEYTLYSSCCNTSKGIYYYTTYNNSSITAVDMHLEDLNGNELVAYPLLKEQTYILQNSR